MAGELVKILIGIDEIHPSIEKGSLCDRAISTDAIASFLDPFLTGTGTLSNICVVMERRMLSSDGVCQV